MGVDARVPVRAGRAWLAGTLALTVGSFAAAVALAPPAGAPPGAALRWLLFAGSSPHIAATAWFFTVREVRSHAFAHRSRYLLAPLALVAGAALLAALLPPDRFGGLLLAFFGWQFYHFQKQNLGLVALAAASHHAGPVPRTQRRAVVAAGLAGTAGLLVHPELLQLSGHSWPRPLFPLCALAYAAAVGTGLAALRHRKPPAPYLAVYLSSLLFFTPVFAFGSPYAAVAGLTLAHGYQYLLLVGLVAAAPEPRGPALVAVAVLVNLALLGGAALSAASHLHSAGPAGRAVYGAYLGVVMAHFVIDAGLWRLRDEFPRRFLRERLPYLLPP
ncbi:MAG TPA: hypothetical protein VJT31_34920 [Rugosimonospora sp.]|nr:hypothetical protein [Rugosimonospora sp.]